MISLGNLLIKYDVGKYPGEDHNEYRKDLYKAGKDGSFLGIFQGLCPQDLLYNGLVGTPVV